MISIKEELENNELRKISDYLAKASRAINKIEKAGHTIQPAHENINNDFMWCINKTNQCIFDIAIAINNLKRTEEGRNIIRRGGNFLSKILQTTKEDNEYLSIFVKAVGTNIYENIKRVPMFVKSIENINTLRVATKNKEYKDFSAEIKKVRNAFDILFGKRNVSVDTENIDYFGY